MKRNILFLSVFLVLTTFKSQAQYGIKAGTSLSIAGSYGNSEEGESGDLKLGYQAGVFYNADLPLGFDLMIELNYESRGTVSKKDYSIMAPVVDPASGTVLGMGEYSVSQEFRSVHRYINIPILFVFGEKKLKFYAGPNVGIMISAKSDFNRTVDVELGGTNVSSTSLDLEDVDLYDYDSFKEIFANTPEEDGDFFNRVEIGLNVGATYSLNDNVFIDLRVSQGLTDITNNNYDFSIYPEEDFSFSSRDDNDCNLGFQLGLGYIF